MPRPKREMVVHEEGEIMQTEQEPTMELTKVSMDLTVLHRPLCSRRGVVNVVNERLPSKEYCTWRG